MDENIFNMDLRKFLKTVGVTSQREIEEAVRQALAAGKLAGSEALAARVVLTVEKSRPHAHGRGHDQARIGKPRPRLRAPAPA